MISVYFYMKKKTFAVFLNEDIQVKKGSFKSFTNNENIHIVTITGTGRNDKLTWDYTIFLNYDMLNIVEERD